MASSGTTARSARVAPHGPTSRLRRTSPSSPYGLPGIPFPVPPKGTSPLHLHALDGFYNFHTFRSGHDDFVATFSTPGSLPLADRRLRGYLPFTLAELPGRLEIVSAYSVHYARASLTWAHTQRLPAQPGLPAISLSAAPWSYASPKPPASSPKQARTVVLAVPHLSYTQHLRPISWPSWAAIQSSRYIHSA